MTRILIITLITAVCTGLAGFAGILLAQNLAPWMTYVLIGVAFITACIGLLMFLIHAPQKEPSAQKFSILMLAASCFVAGCIVAKDDADIPPEALWAFAVVGPLFLPILYFSVWLARPKKSVEPS